MAKRYKCPYCETRAERKDLITHIDKRHEELIPEGYTATRVVFEMINNKNHGTCRICKKDTGWNEKAGRFDTLCGNPKCKETMRNEYKKNMVKVHGTYNILNDPEQQEKMLANRSISGKYKHSDGGVLTYTGSYEKKCLEFMDSVMNIPSKDIMSPGPTLEYIYNGEKHIYITDFMYIPYNLIIEVKDGGDNMNTKMSPSMIASREKTIAKEKMIIDGKVYNYVRLTNNQFYQLIEVFMELKQIALLGDNADSKVIKINEFDNAVEYFKDNIIFDEEYFTSENKKENDRYLLATTDKYNDIRDGIYESIRRNMRYGDYGLCIIANEETNVANCYICNINVLQESVKKAPKTCPKCGGKIGVYIEGEPIYKCKECGEFLGEVPFS